MEFNIYRRMYPTGASSPKFYGLPKIHKKDILLRPIVSSIGSVTYGVAKELARILKPLVDKFSHHVSNTKEIADEIRNTKLKETECITSYDVTALFTSVTVPSALEIIKKRLAQDTDLPNRSIMTADNIMEPVGVCLNNTYFLFQDQFYEQTKGAAMGSPGKSYYGLYIHGGLWKQSHLNSTAPPRIWKEVCWWYLCDFNINHIKRVSSGTSTQWTLPSSSLWRNPRKIVPSPFWTPS